MCFAMQMRPGRTDRVALPEMRPSLPRSTPASGSCGRVKPKQLWVFMPDFIHDRMALRSSLFYRNMSMLTVATKSLRLGIIWRTSVGAKMNKP